MAILNFGSINIDHIYRVPHLPRPGETLASTSRSRGLGGKGANQAIAAARAGARVVHLGAVGPDGEWCVDEMGKAGVDTGPILRLEVPTGHAIIYLDDAGENAIVLFEGANRAIPEAAITNAIARMEAGDWLLMQNETNGGLLAAQVAQAAGMKVAYAAAPFDADAVTALLPHLDLLAVNEVEAAQLAQAFGTEPDALPVAHLLITLGSRGARYRGPDCSSDIAAFEVDVIDTTGGGDVVLGYFLAGLAQGETPAAAMRFASAAAAIQVSRLGTAQVIPDRAEVSAFLRDR